MPSAISFVLDLVQFHFVLKKFLTKILDSNDRNSFFCSKDTSKIIDYVSNFCEAFFHTYSFYNANGEVKWLYMHCNIPTENKEKVITIINRWQFDYEITDRAIRKKRN